MVIGSDMIWHSTGFQINCVLYDRETAINGLIPVLVSPGRPHPAADFSVRTLSQSQWVLRHRFCHYYSSRRETYGSER